ncbi:MAG: DUF4270 family protein [Thermonemataceae bacterium]
MSYLTKLSFQRLSFLLSVIVFIACEDPSDIGLGLQPQNVLGVAFTDTVTVTTSTVLVDSVNTTNSILLIAGQYNDAQLGLVTASSFFTLTPDTINLGSNPQFSRLELNLAYRYSYGDTTQPQTIQVHKLTNAFNQGNTYYSFSELPFDPTPEGSRTFSAKDIVDNRLIIPLEDSFRDEIANLITSTDSLTQEQLDDVVSGLVLVPQGGAAIVGFDANPIDSRRINTASALNLFYENDGEEESYNIYVRNPTVSEVVNGRRAATRFNRVTSDRSGTALADLDESYEEIDATATNNLTYIQGLLGIKTKITFPYLSEFAKLGTIAINRADLVVTPFPPIAEDFTPRPFSLEFWQLDRNERPQRIILTQTVPGQAADDPLQTISDTVIIRVQQEGLNPLGFQNELLTTFDPTPSAYTANFTSYIQFILNNDNPDYEGVNRLENNGLLISPNLNSIRANRVVIGGAQNPTNPLKLRLFYTLVESR